MNSGQFSQFLLQNSEGYQDTSFSSFEAGYLMYLVHNNYFKVFFNSEKKINYLNFLGLTFQFTKT